MCGLAGILKLVPGERPERERLERMKRVLRHRGPDGEGIAADGPAGLVHLRLAILDPAAGAQPMANAAGDAWIAYNGEIYNHPQLRHGLMQRGVAYRTRTDTETILHLYDADQEGCLRRLEGMFAFALWDGARRRLLLARDRLGIKPLYYALTSTELLFASEIKAILAAGGVRPEMNREAIPGYLANRHLPGDETFFRGIRRLPPGHILTCLEGEAPAVRRWWRVPADPRPESDGGRGLPGEVRERLTSAARSHLMSDVPLGLFLSGGLDSTALAALVAPMIGAPLNTFSVGYDDPLAGELPFARLAARSVGAIHREVLVSGREFFQALPRLVWHEDEPIAFTSSVPLYFVSRLARRHVTVVLTGEGADELFLGYNRYRVGRWNQTLGALWWSALPSLSHRVARAVPSLPRRLREPLSRSFLALPPDPRRLVFDNFSVLALDRQLRLWRDPEILSARDPYGEALRCYQEGSGQAADRMSRADMQTYLVELLMKQDQMSMAASLESRVPFLDTSLVERIAPVPGSIKMKGGRLKALLRSALSGLVPAPILKRRKMGFPVPLGSWLRGAHRPILEDLVLGPRAQERGLFRPEALRELVAEHASGEADHSERLWLLLNLELWQRIFLDGEDPPAIPGGVDA
ncbi:MAG TPA: asparagine synthase (glutamine-hydrolyzing) [Candidatus Polarisedimenticolia bacterium]|nr:asparagine synthase (glutamine-hydrolyzing) [Candidatus Polarisedimenticolia bacterium]